MTSAFPTTTTHRITAASSTDQPYPETYYNISVNQKAVYQPAFKFRRWTEEQKRAVPAGATPSTQEIESGLPPLRGPDTSVEQYVQQLKTVEQHLSNFYNGSNRLYQSHAWDAQHARKEEYLVIVDSLLKLVGGAIGTKRKEKNMVVIGIELGQFGSSSCLSSFHNPFLAFFVPLVSVRRLFCEDCGALFHRDEMAGHNMVNIVQGHLLHQQRPLYLQPVDENGHYPWMETEIARDAKDSMDTENTGVAEDKDGQALEETSSSSINDCIPENAQGSSRKAPKRKAPKRKA
ncbi:hypothetical protein BGX27_002542 [Mortierella sp. AM989]|nr:hypothetical protein BGX27_002542 [Mortierella sp. AM989]